MKHLKTFESQKNLKSSDFNIYKIRYYADGINVRKGIFSSGDPNQDKQHHERATEYNKFFWEMVEKVTGHDMRYWHSEYMMSARECITEELFEKYDIFIPNSEEYFYWFIPKTMTEVSEWVEQNCKLPFKKLMKSPYNTEFLNRRLSERPTWQREMSRKFTAETKEKYPQFKK